MVLDRCDDVEVTVSNCQAIYDKWPQDTDLKRRALETIKEYGGNISSLKKCVDCQGVNLYFM